MNPHFHRGWLAAATLLGLAAIAPGSTAAPLQCPAPLAQSSEVAPPGGTPFIICSGRIPSFDGTPIDVDLSIPSNRSAPLPLMVMLHGFGGNKTSWEQQTLDLPWSNAWFVSKGYAVLTYTARGFWDSCGLNPVTGYSFRTDPACAGKASWMHFTDRRWEIHDFQFLTGKMVDAGIAMADKIAVTGDSLGGAQSWLAAVSQDRIVDRNSTDPGHPVTQPWTSPIGTPMHLMAAVPLYAWTDFAFAVMPNGRQSDGFFGAPANGSSTNPPGIEKKSYGDLFLSPQALAVTHYAANGEDPTADVPGWFTGFAAGEPYSAAAVDGISQLANAFRATYAAPVPPASSRTPIFAIAGTTDPLIVGQQVLQIINKFKAADPNYPIWAFFGDLGHDYAGNPPAVLFQALDEANAWLDALKSERAPANPKVTVTTTPCTAGQTVATFTASDFHLIPNSALTFVGSGPALITNASEIPPEGAATDPLTNKGCRVMPAQTDPNLASWTFVPAIATTAVGSPVVTVTVNSSATHAEIAARLWDVDPVSGMQALITRGVYHLTSPGTSTVSFELFTTAWQLQAGHHIKLELTEDDMPFLRYDNLGGSLAIESVALVVPVRN